jgi:RNA polymerase sigma-70 factor (ECF subfamily)
MTEERRDLESAADSLLMAYIADGSGECVGYLVARYKRALLSFLRRGTGSAPEAEDLFQETWVRVVRSAHTYDPEHRFSTWLFRIAWNQVRDYWGRRKAHERTSAPGLEDLDARPVEGPGAEAQMLAQERTRVVSAVVSALPPLLAEAVWLRYFEELTEREMARRLKVPAGTVKSRLHHGLKRLGELLEGEMA